MYHLLELLKTSKVVSRLDILHFVAEEDIQVFSAKADLFDGSLLFVRELITKTEAKYSYQWQTKRNKLICRWDNAPHHRDIETFPHHKHKETQENVLPSKEVTLAQVLKIIAKEIKRKKQ